MASIDRRIAERLRFRVRRSDKPRHAQRLGHDLRERFEALAQWAIGDAVAVDEQTIEEIRTDGQLSLQRCHIELASESSHRRLERMRTTRGGHCNRLAIEHQGTRRKPCYRGGD